MFSSSLFAQSPNIHTELGNRLNLLNSLHIDRLPPLPEDKSNHVLHHPLAIELGKLIFFDSQFSSNQKISCASCHKPHLFFTDGLKSSRGVRATLRNAPTVLGIAYSPWYFWDGRRDSLWSQAITPFEHPNEHGITRIQVLKIVENNALYFSTYKTLFKRFPNLDQAAELATPLGDSELQKNWRTIESHHQKVINRTYANIGKVLAAYVSTLIPGRSKLEDYIDALGEKNILQASRVYTEEEALGLELFMNEKGQCFRCHNGPLLTNHDFHNIGLSQNVGDYGRLQGIGHALIDPFNCFGEYSDADKKTCAELQYAKTSGEDLAGAFKVPTLRNVAETAPYMHDGRYKTLKEVIEHYNEAPESKIGHQELNPLNLTEKEMNQLVAFLRTLTSHERPER